MKFIDITGQKFGRLTALRRSHMANNKWYWVCRCECGVERAFAGDQVRNGHTKSCGCYRRDVSRQIKTIHGRKNTSEYIAWVGIVQRCTNPLNHAWPRYGGRGITMCETWRNSFEAFFQDMGPRPSVDYSIDRIDNDKGYSPDNCRWATATEQIANSRTYKNGLCNKPRVELVEEILRLRERERALIAECERLREAIRLTSKVLNVPAAEYVPAISDAWTILDAALAGGPLPVVETVEGEVSNG